MLLSEACQNALYPIKISKFSPNTIGSQLLSSAECSKYPTSYYLIIFTSQGCTFPQTYLLFRQMCMHCLLTFTTVFPAAWCALLFLNSSPLRTVSFYHVHRWASMFLICYQNNFILPWLPACTFFLICSSLQTASFCHVDQETMVFLILFPLPMFSFCHDYQQASMFLISFPIERLQFAVFTDNMGLECVHRFPFNSEVLYSCHC